MEWTFLLLPPMVHGLYTCLLLAGWILCKQDWKQLPSSLSFGPRVTGSRPALRLYSPLHFGAQLVVDEDLQFFPTCQILP